MEERNKNLNLEKSRNGLTVPYINGVYLHSIYNPKKEADMLADEQEKQLKTKNYVLILGLGFGYHVESIAKKLNSFHSTYKIIILEPNLSLINEFKKMRPFEDKNIEIVHFDNCETLYSQKSFVEFLMKKPAVIRHEASFSINKNDYLDFLKFKSVHSPEVYQNVISENARKLLNLNHNNHHEKVNAIYQKGRMTNHSDYLVMAFNQLTKVGI